MPERKQLGASSDAEEAGRCQPQTELAWSDQRMEQFLYGEDRATSHIIDEDEPADDSDAVGDLQGA